MCIWINSKVRFLWIHVEIFKESGFLSILEIVKRAKSFVSLDSASANRSDLIQNYWAPNISILHRIESFVASTHKHINVINWADFIILAPVVCKLHFCLLWVSVSTIAKVVDYKWHVAAVLSKETQWLHVSFNDWSWSRYINKWVKWSCIPGAETWSWGI